jgi:ABC-type lipoprotein export system ATPase subunit
MENKTLLKLENVTKIYKNDNSEIIKNVYFSMDKGSNVALVGSSGCGKTTFLQICGLLDSHINGNIFIDNININTLTDNEITKIRKKHIGFVFQFHHLLPEFSVIENVLMPAMIDNKDYKDYAMEILNELGIYSKINNRPYQISGGERQRVAIARAIINKPGIVLADEPTGNLDEKNAMIVFELLLKIVEKYNSTLLIVTHNYELAKKLNTIITIKDKQIETIK